MVSAWAWSRVAFSPGDTFLRVAEIGDHYRLPVANVFHAGDGNLHPNILFDLRDDGILEQVGRAGEEMLRAVVEVGGTLSGEHGIGIEKNAFMPWIYSPDDLDAMLRVKHVFDPAGLLNPGVLLGEGGFETRQLG